MSDEPCVNPATHPPHAWGNLNWCPGDDGVGDDIRLCDGCGENYNPHEESHVGHEGNDPETVFEALGDVCLRFCIPDQHDPACRILRENLDGPLPLSDEERVTIGEVLHREGFYAPAVRARILDVFDATLAMRRGGGDEW